VTDPIKSYIMLSCRFHNIFLRVRCCIRSGKAFKECFATTIYDAYKCIL